MTGPVESASHLPGAVVLQDGRLFDIDPIYVSAPAALDGSYVYAHTRCDTGAVFYVGKGRRKRAWDVSSRNRMWKFVAAKHGRSVWILAFGLDNDTAYAVEQAVIAAVPAGTLATFTDGGKGAVGYRHTEKAKAAMSAWRTGRSLSAETRRKLAETINASAEHIARRSAAFSGERNPAKQQKNRLASSERMKANNPMKCLESRAKASAALTGRTNSAESRAKISAALKGRKRGPMKAHVRAALSSACEVRKRPVKTACGLRFSSALEAAKALGVHQGSISNNCIGRQKSAGGYTWSYDA